MAPLLAEERPGHLVSQEELHRTYVSSAERGERNVALVNIERLAKALGVDTSDLIPDDG
jgi:transcriptional regulator with XRE-family HTH domain